LARLEQVMDHNRRLEKEVAALNTKLVSGESLDAADAVFEVQGIPVLVNLIDGAIQKVFRMRWISSKINWAAGSWCLQQHKRVKLRSWWASRRTSLGKCMRVSWSTILRSKSVVRAVVDRTWPEQAAVMWMRCQLLWHPLKGI